MVEAEHSDGFFLFIYLDSHYVLHYLGEICVHVIKLEIRKRTYFLVRSLT